MFIAYACWHIHFAAASRDMTTVKQKTMIYLIIMVLTAMAVNAEDGVSITNGQVKVHGYKNCTFENNGKVIKHERQQGERTMIIDDLMFGLIKWNCDGNYKGELVSFFECGDCSMYCVYNQYLEKCRTTSVPIVTAIVLSSLLSMLFLILGITVLKDKINNLIFQTLMWFIMINDNKRAKLIRKHNKITGQNLEVKFKKIKYSNRHIMNEVIKRRLKLSGHDENNEEMYAEILYNGSSDGRAADRLLNETENRLERLYRTTNPPKRYSPATSIVRGTAILAAMSQQPTYACDQMLYLKSNGRICYKENCYDLSTYSLLLSDGQIACFNDLDNNRLSIKFDKLEHVARYSKIYDTCKYNITNEMTWNCYGAGKCWGGAECGNGYALNVLEKHTSNPYGYGCHMTPVSCTWGCTHGLSCVWYRWEVVPELDKLAHVYQSVSELWTGELTITYKGNQKTIKLDTNNPKFDLNDIIISEMTHMPVYINSASYEKPMYKDSLIEYEGRVYNMDASPHNLPIKNMIGDIQISKDKKMAFHTDSIDCSTDSCTVKCILNEPSISRLTAKSPYVLYDNHIERLTIYGENWLNYKTRVPGHISMSFGNIELKELIVEKPHCKIDPIMTYACIACLEQPRVVLGVMELKKEGALQYESNCTWDRSMLSCNLEMYELIQISKNAYCRIYIPILNQTLDINFEYEYRGDLTNMKSIRAETTSEILKSIVSDPSFYITLISSLSSFFIITALSSIIIKIARLGVLAFGRKEVQEA